MKQYYFDKLHFNLMYNGLTFSTLTWNNLLQTFKSGKVYIFDWEIDIKSKIAKETSFIKDIQLSNKSGYSIGNTNYTGQEIQLI